MPWRDEEDDLLRRLVARQVAVLINWTLAFLLALFFNHKGSSCSKIAKF